MEIISAILVAIVGSIAGGIVGAFFAWFKIKPELEKEYKNRINEQKWKAYSGFASYMGQLRGVSKPYELSNSVRMISDLLLVADDSVLKAYRDYISLVRALDLEMEISEENKKKAGDSFMAILVKMREDLGYESSNRDDLSLLYSQLDPSPEYFNQMKKSLFFYSWLEQQDK